MADVLLAELAEEMKTTRRCIERVPSEKDDWKPHPKSFSLAHLAQLVSSMPGWITKIVQGADRQQTAAGGREHEPEGRGRRASWRRSGIA